MTQLPQPPASAKSLSLVVELKDDFQPRTTVGSEAGSPLKKGYYIIEENIDQQTGSFSIFNAVSDGKGGYTKGGNERINVFIVKNNSTNKIEIS